MARSLFRFGLSLTLLAALLWWMDAAALRGRISELRIGWVLVALGLSLPQVALSALRWRLTAGRLGIEVPFRVALREYYLGTFLNQILPGGVMGDVSRAWRQARAGAETRLRVSARAVILERASGQLVVGVLALASLPVAFGAVSGGVFVALTAACGVVLLGSALARWSGAPGATGRAGRVRSHRQGEVPRGSADETPPSLWRDVHTALLAPDVVGFQLAISSLVVSSYVLTFLAAARAVGVEAPFTTLLPLVAPVLASMVVPVSVAGWGVREAAAAALWGAVGLPILDGMAISVAYGLLVLLSSLPGALVLLGSRTPRRPTGAPGRRGRPLPDESGGSGVEAPGKGSPVPVG